MNKIDNIIIYLKMYRLSYIYINTYVAQPYFKTNCQTTLTYNLLVFGTSKQNLEKHKK